MFKVSIDTLKECRALETRHVVRRYAFPHKGILWHNHTRQNRYMPIIA
ncbi:hypothetical protein [Bartonella grahamii]